MIMRINCQYCQTPNFLGDAQIEAAIAAAETAGQAQHVLKCNKCRKVLKVSVQQLKRYAPKSEPKDTL